MPTGAANPDRARIVRSLLSLAVVGTLLMATLVPLPGLYCRLKNAASPSVALRDWERDDRERLIAEIFALPTTAIRVKATQLVPATEGQKIYFGYRPFPMERESTTSDDESALLQRDGNLETDQQPNDASRP
jgi:hypothetical protein